MKRIVREVPATESANSALLVPRDDLVLEARTASPDVFTQASGPFVEYERVVATDGEVVRETTSYRLSIPWFGWLFAWPIRRTLARRDQPRPNSTQPWWAPPDRLEPRQAMLLGLLAAASMSAAFTNTLFTQKVNFAAKDFGIDKFGQGVGGVVVRVGIVFALPIAFLADRVGRRRMPIVAAFLAPVVSSLGALAPNFPALVATQSFGRPMGLALDLLIAVVATEEMP